MCMWGQELIFWWKAHGGPTRHKAAPAFRFLAPGLAPDLALPLAAGFLPLALREVPALAEPLLRPVAPPALLPDFLDGFEGDLRRVAGE